MKIMLKLSLFVFLFASTSFAGVFDSTKVVLPHKGAQALEFGLSGLLNFNSYIGNSISLKKSSERHTKPLDYLYIHQFTDTMNRVL